jgi:glycosyltransferase involved in cell wall biosynthesis
MRTKGRIESVMKATARMTFGCRWSAIMEMRNKILFAPNAFVTRRATLAEVARLRQQMPQIPAAKVATIIPAYRRPELLKRAVRSALDQTVRDHVVVVVDDAGGLPALPADPRLYVISLSINLGDCGVVRNVGICLTSSEYVAFLDDDNEWDPCHLNVALDAFSTSAQGEMPGLVYTAVQRYLPDGRLIDILSMPFDRRLLARAGYIDSNSLVVRRFPGLRFSWICRPKRLQPREDWEFVHRLSRSMGVVHSDVPTVRYLINPESYFTEYPPDSDPIWRGSGQISRSDLPGM